MHIEEKGVIKGLSKRQENQVNTDYTCRKEGWETGGGDSKNNQTRSLHNFTGENHLI